MCLRSVGRDRTRTIQDGVIPVGGSLFDISLVCKVEVRFALQNYILGELICALISWIAPIKTIEGRSASVRNEHGSITMVAKHALHTGAPTTQWRKVPPPTPHAMQPRAEQLSVPPVIDRAHVNDLSAQDTPNEPPAHATRGTGWVQPLFLKNQYHHPESIVMTMSSVLSVKLFQQLVACVCRCRH